MTLEASSSVFTQHFTIFPQRSKEWGKSTASLLCVEQKHSDYSQVPFGTLLLESGSRLNQANVSRSSSFLTMIFINLHFILFCKVSFLSFLLAPHSGLKRFHYCSIHSSCELEQLGEGGEETGNGEAATGSSANRTANNAGVSLLADHHNCRVMGRPVINQQHWTQSWRIQTAHCSI